VKSDRGLGRRRREEVDRELGQGGDEQERCSEDQQAERKHQARQVPEPAAGDRRRDDLPGVGDRGMDDAAGSAADLAVACEEARGPGAVEVWDHHFDCDQRDRGPGDQDRRSFESPPMREGVPDAEPSDDERDLLLRGRGDEAEDRKGHETVLVEVPEGEKEERTG